MKRTRGDDEEKKELPNKKKLPIIMYTDGACSRNGTTNAKAGIGVYFKNGEYNNISEPLDLRPATNQRAELRAIYVGLYEVAKDVDVILYTDSMYSINCITKWHIGWAKNGWKNAKKQPVENQDLIKPLLNLVKKRTGNTKYIHVRGHSGDEGNNKADELARAGIHK